ncbi:hypothetical protein PG999_010625 [Apiospora kogelbergensis]|uniref:Uncharacterized protein n=1 Tax=Apiospora kogelbergensis TaxID=1337665 RepID=A0AAW0QLH8_9PEZI
MTFNISSVGQGNYLLHTKEKDIDGHWGLRPVTYEPRSNGNDGWGSADTDSSCDSPTSEPEEMATAYIRKDPLFYQALERYRHEAPARPERWNRAGPWEGYVHLKIEDGANDRGFMEPMERTPRRSRNHGLLSLDSGGLSDSPKSSMRTLDSHDDDDDLRDCCEFFDWADKEWTESYAGRAKEEILERNLFRDELRDWTPSELKARFGVSSKAYLIKMLRRRKLVMLDGEAYDAMLVERRKLQEEAADGIEDADGDDDGGYDAFLDHQRDGRTHWGHMTVAEQDAFSTALAQNEVGMCKMSGLCDLPEFDGYPQAVFVPLSPTKEEFEPRTP